ncbi:DUF3164 family protein [Oceaniglobus trochenteri]|uniref:DUF3164 family protein n=1 Tax=Oceaniglobus trochenteri TaxID=2763260 RepID=UPI001CFFCBB6|nr:DUF3164 family protein [Oceaniglobus trochenteri]
MSVETTHELPPGQTMIDGRPHMRDAKGRAVPIDLVSDADQLKTQTVLKVLEYARPLSAQIARFKGHTFDDVYTLVDLLREQHGASVGGAKGNIDLISFDGCARVQVSVADHIAFGPELGIAKSLIDECIEEWSDGSRDEIRALVNHAFNTDKAGNINREALFSLRRLDIRHPTWKKAMQAITDSMSVIGSKSYIRIYTRATPEKGWEMVPLNIAAV